jgi:hypothetical protein
LFGAHALGTGALGFGPALVQILQKLLVNGSVFIDDAANHFQLFALRIVENGGYQRHLFWPFFAHFVTGSFSLFTVILNIWRLFICYKAKRITTTK